jgi:hypothetical protein
MASASASAGQIDLASVYEQLKAGGFYDNINKLSFGSKTVNLPNINRQVKENRCADRVSNEEHYKTIGDYYKLYISPCRIGREIKNCAKKVVCVGEQCVVKDPETTCPLCGVVKDTGVSPCSQLNKIIRTETGDEELIIIPNAFPYLERHFLITSKNHLKQDFINTAANLGRVVGIAERLLTAEAEAEAGGVVFFNGYCGNSLEHFHCQYTISKFPIFENITVENGLLENPHFRGYVITGAGAELVQRMSGAISKIVAEGLLYNFIMRRIGDGRLQAVLFVRSCKLAPGMIDMNFGATELSGVIASAKKLKNTEEEIMEYVNYTNRVSDYAILTGSSGAGMSRSRRSSTRKSRTRKTRSRK